MKNYKYKHKQTMIVIIGNATFVEHGHHFSNSKDCFIKSQLLSKAQIRDLKVVYALSRNLLFPGGP